MLQVGNTVADILDKSNNSPHIVAYGMSREEILHFYIVVDGELIDVS